MASSAAAKDYPAMAVAELLLEARNYRQVDSGSPADLEPDHMETS